LLAHSQQDTVFIRYNIADYEEPVSYKIDTLLFDNPSERERSILIGTTVLPWTSGQINAKNYGIDFLKTVTLNPCESSGEKVYTMTDKILSIIETEDKLEVSIEISANCCHSFLCDVEIIDEKTINLITHGYGSWCACMCCFGLTFHFDTMKNIENYSKLRYIIINGQEETRRKIR
jgi:hypothetical protein